MVKVLLKKEKKKIVLFYYCGFIVVRGNESSWFPSYIQL